MPLVGGKVVPEMLEVRSLTPGDERLRRRSIESNVPNRRIVVDRLPPFDSWEEPAAGGSTQRRFDSSRKCLLLYGLLRCNR